MTSSKHLLACSLLAALPLAAQQLIVTGKEANVASLAKKYNAIVVRTLDGTGNVHLVRAPDAIIAKAIGTLITSTSAVNAVEADHETELSESDATSKAATSKKTDPLDPGSPTPANFYGDIVRAGYVNQFSSSLINLPAVHNQYTLGGGIVAVIDTGIDPKHPALQRWIVPGYDFVNDRPGVPDETADVSQSTVGLLDRTATQVPVQVSQSTVGLLDQSTVGLLDGNHLPGAFGHGTMTAGLIHLVAPNAKIMPLKAFHADGTGAISDIVAAIYYAADHGANVINMSFSSTTSSQALTDAIKYAISKKIICVASAGNEGKELTVYPAGIPGVVGVASTNSQDIRSVFSNRDAASTKMAAPGEALITAYPGGHYAGVWGTSFSAALVSGAAALMTQVQPKATPSLVSDAFEHGKRIDQDIGDARLDVLASLLYCLHNY